ncbi:hypothetical protein P8452_43976 [Trifolium repens]|nr:hypothetical protein P8452_43976 [Trifolium repens]
MPSISPTLVSELPCDYHIQDQTSFKKFSVFVKAKASEYPKSGPDKPITVAEVEPLVKDFANSRISIKRIYGGCALNKDLVSISSIMHTITVEEWRMLQL